MTRLSLQGYEGRVALATTLSDDELALMQEELLGRRKEALEARIGRQIDQTARLLNLLEFEILQRGHEIEQELLSEDAQLVNA